MTQHLNMSLVLSVAGDRLDFSGQYLYLLNDGLELRRTVSPLFQQLHGLVEILHVLRVHLEEGCEFLQDVSDTRCGHPAGRGRRS